MPQINVRHAGKQCGLIFSQETKTKPKTEGLFEMTLSHKHNSDEMLNQNRMFVQPCLFIVTLTVRTF